jgi:hypothetical protein
MLLYLAGVNEHAALRIVGSKRWRVSHLLRTIQYLFEYGVRFLATCCYCTSCEGLRRRKERNYFLFADHTRSDRPGVERICQIRGYLCCKKSERFFFHRTSNYLLTAGLIQWAGAVLQSLARPEFLGSAGVLSRPTNMHARFYI